MQEFGRTKEKPRKLRQLISWPGFEPRTFRLVKILRRNLTGRTKEKPRKLRQLMSWPGFEPRTFRLVKILRRNLTGRTKENPTADVMAGIRTQDLSSSPDTTQEFDWKD